MSDTNTTVLSTVASNLAIKLSDLSDELQMAPDSLRPVLDDLLEHAWVKAQPVGAEIIYRITADGVLELERTQPRRTVFSLFKK